MPVCEIWEKMFHVTRPQKNHAAKTVLPLPIAGACARKMTLKTTL